MWVMSVLFNVVVRLLVPLSCERCWVFPCFAGCSGSILVAELFRVGYLVLFYSTCCALFRPFCEIWNIRLAPRRLSEYIAPQLVRETFTIGDGVHDRVCSCSVWSALYVSSDVWVDVSPSSPATHLSAYITYDAISR